MNSTNAELEVKKDLRPVLVSIPSELHYRISEAKWRTRKAVTRLVAEALAKVDWETVE